LLEKVFRYYERMGRYDRAEDVLYEILEVKPEFSNEGVQFYERLLKRSDEELVKGNLPRDEVLEGMQEMKKSPAG